MAKRGRKPLPKLKLVQGGKPKPLLVPKNVDTPPQGLPTAGQALWKNLVPELKRLGLLTPLDLPAFFGLCLSWGLVCDAATTLADEGYTVAGIDKTIKKHPALTMLNEQLTQFRLHCAEFGLTPSARERLRLLPEDEVDAMERLLTQRP